MLIIDRIEEDQAVLECSNPATGEVFTQNLPLSWILDDVHEGDVLCKTHMGYVVDRAETEKRRRAIMEQLRHLKPE